MKKNFEYITGPTREAAQRAAAACKAKGTFDFVADYSSTITVNVLMPLMGLRMVRSSKRGASATLPATAGALSLF